MARTDDDTWDLAYSVGVTATGVAVGRALASRVANPLINDPFAEPLVRAVGIDFFTWLASGELDPAAVGGGSTFDMRQASDMMAIRTRFFDDFFMKAADSGIRQAVILASGLDARAYRLPWPAATVVYEIDQPEVIEFKTKVLGELGAAPTADSRAVGIDLRQDWPAALRQAGFDPAQPTAWSAEGLLAFLPPEAQDRLLDDISALSAPGSGFTAENISGMGEAAATMQSQMQTTTDKWREHGMDIDMTDLWYVGDRNDVAEYLAGYGWTTVSTDSTELAGGYGLWAEKADRAGTGGIPFSYVTATRI